jgi:hypothetical protein
MKRRSGVTLVEVLVAIFVMALGLLTLLALFPLGALTMAQAIQDDRTANAVTNATAVAIVQDVRHDTNVAPLFQNPNAAVFADAAPDGPGNPVYVDPMGTYNYLAPYSQWVGGQNNGGVPRVAPAFIANFSQATGQTQTQVALQWFSLLDDIQFDTNGLPNQIAANTFQRDNLYSWAYLLRRPLQGDPTVVEMTVVAYNKRPLTLNGLAQGDENLFNVSFDLSDPAANLVNISWTPPGQTGPNLRVGSWIMDTTPVASATVQGKFAPPHAYFYRVVAITETSDTSMTVEVQTPLRSFPAGQVSNGTIVVMDGVAEVFEKGTGWHP